jgi:mono/diheme cytochrome c family protein
MLAVRTIPEGGKRDFGTMLSRTSLALLLTLALSSCRERPLQFPVEPTRARLERGKYLVDSVAICFQCHSEIDWTGTPAGLPVKGGLGAGRSEKIPLLVAIPNITPDQETGAGSWTDEQLYRAMTQGIGHDGRTLFPEMPYAPFRKLSGEDLGSIIVYLRSLPPVRKVLPKSEIPKDVQAGYQPIAPNAGQAPPDLSTPEKRGAYLALAAGCADCHTPPQGLGKVSGLDYAGGFLFQGPWGTVSSANLTPDPSGIPYYDERMFLEVMRTGVNGARKLAPIMPWMYFREMTTADLRSVFAYLRSLKPVPHRTDNTEPPMPCRKCGNRHGLGAMN